MTIDEKLELIGFTNFVHLKKNKRDGVKRYFFNSIYKDNWFSIMLVKVNNQWCVEEVKGNKGVLELFGNAEITLNGIMNFFKFYYYVDSDIREFL